MKSDWVLQGARTGLTSAGYPHERELIGEFPTQEAAIRQRERLIAPRFIRKGKLIVTVYNWKWTAITRKRNNYNG